MPYIRNWTCAHCHRMQCCRACKPGQYEELNDSNKADKSALPDYVINSAKFAYETEEKRGKGLEQLATKLLECITILSVALLTPATALFEYYGSGSNQITTQQTRLAWMYAIVFFLLLTALCLTLYSQIKRKMLLPLSPTLQLDSYRRMENKEKELGASFSAYQLAETYAKALGTHCDGMRDKHEKMWGLIRASMYIIIAACSLTGCFAAFLLFEFL